MTAAQQYRPDGLVDITHGRFRAVVRAENVDRVQKHLDLAGRGKLNRADYRGGNTGNRAVDTNGGNVRAADIIVKACAPAVAAGYFHGASNEAILGNLDDLKAVLQSTLHARQPGSAGAIARLGADIERAQRALIARGLLALTDVDKVTWAEETVDDFADLC